jgi:galactose oxidase
VPLLDGTILAIGGLLNSTPDIYNPYSDQWTTLDPMPVRRMDHSTALLLPDGSVWSGGSDGVPAAEKGYAIYKPPYFYQGARPQIVSVEPNELLYGRGVTITVGEAATNITKVRLVRLGATTHGYDHDTRRWS